MKIQTVVSEIFQKKYIRYSGSWTWLRSGFEEEYDRLRSGNLLLEDGPGEKIWNTKSKFALKVDDGRRTVVFKTYRKMREVHYMFHISPLAFEAVNYGKLEQMGFPMAKLLAVGDMRKCFLCKSGFLMTEFVENSFDGRVFMPGGSHADNKALRDDFCRAHLGWLAKLHDAGIFHRAFTPANLLWRFGKDGKTLEPIWIDVASCRKKSSQTLRKLIPQDPANLFAWFELSREEVHAMLEFYYGKLQNRRMTFERLETACLEEMDKKTAKIRFEGQAK